MAGFLQTCFFVASFIPWLLVDGVGRRIFMLSMISVMAGIMATQAALIYQVQNKTSVAHSAGIAAAVMLFIFEGAFTIGFQATLWVYPVRDSTSSPATEGVCHLNSGELDLQLRNRRIHTPSNL